VDGLKNEYKSLLASSKSPIQKFDAFRENSQRNRYRDVICLDATRVQLTHDVPPATDYIHANWVKFDKFDRVYILTQAPLTNTIGDFWRMVVQCQSPSIVNLTQDIENENLKCVMYWPQHAGSFNTYDKIFVNTKRVSCSTWTFEGCSLIFGERFSKAFRRCSKFAQLPYWFPI
ncbi:Protein-tyrosine phosphatase, partial [Cooperia oncophora]